MAEAVEPLPAQFFAGLLCADENLFLEAADILTEKYSGIDLQSSVFFFDHTSYYSEMGDNLKKFFISFEELLSREAIVEMKLFTNELEKRLSLSGKQRLINIDPGYMTLSNVFLASCKDFYHRVYLAKGIFLENEYRYINKEYTFWPWTYPDYQKKEYLDYFYSLRRIYQKKLKTQ